MLASAHSLCSMLDIPPKQTVYATSRTILTLALANVSVSFNYYSFFSHNAGNAVVLYSCSLDFYGASYCTSGALACATNTSILHSHQIVPAGQGHPQRERRPKSEPAKCRRSSLANLQNSCSYALPGPRLDRVGLQFDIAGLGAVRA